MDYKPKYIDGVAIQELKNEVTEMYEGLYKYGYSIDRGRLWDIKYTLSILEK